VRVPANPMRPEERVTPADPSMPDPQLEELLEYVRRTRNSDFTGYKRASLTRRITKRMQALGLDSYGEYLDHLEVDPDEFSRFFDSVLINVTAFFRDDEAWDALRQAVTDRFRARGSQESPIRVWSAGTSSGQEAYTLAMVMSDVLGAEQFRRRVKIYGTDVDDDALATARHAAYSERDFESLPAELRSTYFEQVNGEVTFRSDLRRAVIFGRHDLVQDAPISRLDLLVCRNTLMYLNAETQARILDRFHFALADDGVLFLGQAETLMTHGGLFRPIDLKHRLFEKSNGTNQRDRAILTRARPDERAARDDSVDRALTQLSFDCAPVPALVVDVSGRVALINSMARRTFRLSDLDLARPFQDLDLSFRPVELRSSIETAYRERRPMVHRDVEYPAAPGQARFLDIEVMPLFDRDDSPSGVSITFADVTRHRELQEQLAQTNHQLEDAYEELQSTNEELETTNEELQSTVEELETTNEELQSTNEELETMNEELQSTNDELQAANEELRLRGDQLNEVNAFLESILSGLRRAVVVVDRTLAVQVWNELAADLWGLRHEEVLGRPVTDLDCGLPVDVLRQPLQRVIAGISPSEELEVDAHNRRGQPIGCSVIIGPRLSSDSSVAGALMLMQEIPATNRV
jgi:two-component system, chemotaxis family, CheB/CheR fusion protein